MTRPSLFECMMNTAKQFALRSTCSRLQVGTVITNWEMSNILAIGYNGGAKGQKNECESNLPGQCLHLHSEINALIKCKFDESKKRMFITHSPCIMCAKAIINAGIAEIYFEHKYRDNTPIDLLVQAKIKVVHMK